MMIIEFPCPASSVDLTSVNGGEYCSQCKKKVHDVTNFNQAQVNELLQIEPNACVSFLTNKPHQNTRFSISRFALALMLIFGTGLFSFKNAQVENGVKKIKENTIAIQKESRSVGLIEVVIKGKKGYRIYGDVIAVLPNGMEVDLKENNVGNYFMEVPLFCKGKDIQIIVRREGKEKSKMVVLQEFNEQLLLNFKFKVHSDRRFRLIGCPSF